MSQTAWPSTTEENTGSSKPADFFKANTASVLTEIVEALPFRHEWERDRLNEAIANLENDPDTILSVSDVRAPTQGADNPQIKAMQDQIAELTALVKSNATPETSGDSTQVS